MGPGYLKGKCSKPVFLKGMGVIGEADNYFLPLMPGNYEVKHGLIGSWQSCTIVSLETTTLNFD